MINKFLVTSLLLFLPLVANQLTLKKYLEFVNLVKENCTLDSRNHLPASDLRKKCVVKTEYSWACWPESFANTTVTVACPWIFYKSGTLTRICNENGTWEKIHKKTCALRGRDDMLKMRSLALLQLSVESEKEQEEEAERVESVNIRIKVLEYVRYADTAITFVSLIVLLMVPGCDNIRVNLHRNLVAAFFLGDLVHCVILNTHTDMKVCNAFFVILQYFFLVQVCCMFSEGLHRTITIYRAFVERASVVPYTIFSWVSPAVVVFIIFLPVMKTDPPKTDKFGICWAFYQSYKFNYIVFGPAFTLLAVNTLFILYIVYIVMTEKRNERDASECTVAIQGFRGFALSFFLLGGGYMVTLYGPSGELYAWFRTIIQPTQGTLVCLFNVVLSKEVRRGLKKRTRQFKSSQSMQSLSHSFAKSSKRYNFGSSSSSLATWKGGKRQSVGSDAFPEVENIHGIINGPGGLTSARGSQISIEGDWQSSTLTITTDVDDRRGSTATVNSGDFARRESLFMRQTIEEDDEEKGKTHDEIECVNKGVA